MKVLITDKINETAKKNRRRSGSGGDTPNNVRR